MPGLVEKLSAAIPGVNTDKIRNEIKRELRDRLELRGSRKTGTHYFSFAFMFLEKKHQLEHKRGLFKHDISCLVFISLFCLYRN